MRIHAQNVWLKSVVGALCALVLLAHAAFVLHKATVVHPADDTCEYCLAGNNLTGPVSIFAPALAFAVQDSPTVVVEHSRSDFTLRVYDGRAPPVASFS